ncbi:hypothetical protein [Haladaptatus sp. DYSN1]|uniref:hypothetical protein n=1 Tax=unclassified Haladaptatus TaxID=2622732 RepID=UPI0024060137|nr:hypothetical protein [Haladaptatus sp. DYSN1]
MRPLPILCVGVLLVLAGCTLGPLGPTGQKGPVTVVVNNSADTTHTFEVWVVELPANVTERRDDGLTATGSIGQGLGGGNPGDNHTFTAVELPDSARLHGRYTLDPGEKNRSSIEEFHSSFAVVIVVYLDEDEIISYVTANCDEADFVALGVTSRPNPPGGVSAAYTCQ